MAHTCPQCCAPRHLIVAPVIDVDDEDGHELISGGLSKKKIRFNLHYNHDRKSWKRTTRAQKQYERHLRRLTSRQAPACLF